jgi:hypothetical protein
LFLHLSSFSHVYFCSCIYQVLPTSLVPAFIQFLPLLSCFCIYQVSLASLVSAFINFLSLLLLFLHLSSFSHLYTDRGTKQMDRHFSCYMHVKASK